MRRTIRTLMAAGTVVAAALGVAGLGAQAATASTAARSFTVSSAPRVKSLTIDVFSEGGVVLVSHTHVFSGTTADNKAFGVVQLTAPAPAGGQIVTLTSSNPNVASVPASITVPAGQVQGSFVVDPLQVTSPVKVTLSAAIGGRAATAPLTVVPSNLMELDIDAGPPVPNIFSGGTPHVGTVLFNGIAPPGNVVTLTSSSPDASIPASVTVAPILPTNFTITTSQVTASTSVTITATWRSKTVSATMTLQPPPTLQAPASGASFAAGAAVTFQWHTPAGLSSQIQVATDQAFTNLVENLNTEGAQTWTFTSLPSGTLYWRVRGVDVYGVQGPPSAVRTLTVR